MNLVTVLGKDYDPYARTSGFGADNNFFANLTGVVSDVWGEVKDIWTNGGKDLALEALRTRQQEATARAASASATSEDRENATLIDKLLTVMSGGSITSPDQVESAFSRAMAQSAPWLIGAGILVVGLIAVTVLSKRRR